MTKRKQVARPARTKGDLRVIHADGSEEIISKREADLRARDVCKTIDLFHEQRLSAAVPIDNP